MECVAGVIWRPGEGAAEGWLLHDGGRILDAGEGRPPQAPAATGFVMPAPIDAHTHVGDRVGRGVDIRGLSLAEVVAPPHGLKHRLLRDTPPEALEAGMRAAMAEARAAGTRTIVDFREQGVDGLRMLRRAARGLDLRVVAMGRPVAWTDAELDDVAREADGIGLSALGDVADDAPERAAAAARRHRKPFALHLSEARREDVGRALDLRPQFLVHVATATDDDLRAIAAARVPIVTCPRSNERFGLRADAPRMLALGIPLAIGSDNAMLHANDALEDARVLAARHPDVPCERWLEALTLGGARALGEAPRSWLRRGDDAALVVLDPTDRLALKA